MKNTRLDSKISIPCDLVFRYTSLTFFRERKGKEKNGKILYVISRNARVKISQGQFEKVPLHPGDNWRGQIHSEYEKMELEIRAERGPRFLFSPREETER